MEYREYAPAERLASIVHCVWTLEGDARELDDEVQPILPDGRPELVLHFGDAFERVDAGGASERQPPVLFAGQLTRQLLLRPTGRISVVGVRFHSYGAASLIPVPQNELVGRTVGVDLLSKSLFRSLSEVRASATSVEQAVRMVQHDLTRAARMDRLDHTVRRAGDAIHSSCGLVSIEALAGGLGITRRHLERLFKTHVGMSPKRLARVVRFQHALHVLDRADSSSPGAETAAACGYADQAHFVREFRELCGQSPSAHLLQRAELTGFFLTASA
jgi:AraC-like DNA-binding protein